MRNTKQYRNPKFKCSKLLNLDHLIFEFVSSFDIRISNFNIRNSFLINKLLNKNLIYA
jgi:hypothetical protein